MKADKGGSFGTHSAPIAQHVRRLADPPPPPSLAPAQATPSAETAMFYFQTNHLHFTPEFLGRVRLAGSCASLAGVALYNTAFKQVPSPPPPCAPRPPASWPASP